jgi:hypothetical protein
VATALTAFLPYVLPYALDCAPVVAQQALLKASIEFCDRTLVYSTVAPFDVTINQMDYPVTVPTGYRLAKVMGVMTAGRWLKSVTRDQVRDPVAWTGAAVGAESVPTNNPNRFFQRDIAVPTVSLWPVPQATVAAGGVIRAAFSPLQTQTTVPDILFTNYYQAIADGALSHILAIAEQPFSNPKEAERRGMLFDAAMRNAQVQVRDGLVVAASSVRMRKFA